MGPKTCIDEYIELGIKQDNVTLLELGKEVTYKNVKIKAVYADHGQLALDAIGVLLTIRGIKFYFSADTAYRPDMIKDIINFETDIAVLSVNGKFGNLNCEEGAKIARDIKAKIAILCYFWTFKEHGGYPELFGQEMTKYAPDCKTKFMSQGELYIYSR